MIEDEHGPDDELETAAIGVGMGGSCPVCRAPVDLGQEFCLECGSPIRFTPRQRKQGRATDTVRTTAPVATSRPKGGFPWVPFLIVLALLVGGGAFAIVEGGSPSSSRTTNSNNDDDSSLPEITNSTNETTSETSTETLQDCIGAADGTQPAVPAGSPDTTGASSGLENATSGNVNGAGEQVPTIAPADGIDEPFDTPGGDTGGVPGTTPGEPGTVTVDQDGNLCPAATGSTDPATTTPTTSPDGATPTSTTPTSTTPTSTTPTSTTPASSTGDWPAGKQGWTLVVYSLPSEQRANEKAADVQEQGLESGVLDSNDYVSLCPGYFVVFSGVFDSRDKAQARYDQFRNKGFGAMYVREIRTTGAKATCTPVQ